jgi:hypothetical protein
LDSSGRDFEWSRVGPDKRVHTVEWGGG